MRSVFRKLSLTLFGTTLLVLGTGSRGKAIIATDSNALFDRILFPGDFSGVVQLGRNPEPFSSGFCTASLLTGGQYLLTAAHCLTDSSGLLDFNPTSTFAYFNLPTGPASIAVNDVFIHPDWSGNLLVGNDVALLSLAELAPDTAAQYDIYRDTNEIGQIFTKVGYGEIGTGDFGEGFDELGNTLSNLFNFGFYGFNEFDATEVILPGLFADSVFSLFNEAPTPVIGSQLLFDFDNGSPLVNALGSLGLGSFEVNTARGDSGGPAFIGNQIAGITSYGLDWLFGVDTDVVGDPFFEGFGSFGELSGEVRVSSYTSFIDAVLLGQVPSSLTSQLPLPATPPTEAIPEPTTIVGTLAFGSWLYQRRQTWKKRRPTLS